MTSTSLPTTSVLVLYCQRSPGWYMSGSRASRDVLGRGLRVLGQAIRVEPRLFTAGVVGSSVFGLLIIANSYVVGAVIGHVVVPAFADRRVEAGTLALVAAVFLGLSVLRVASIFGRRLGAGFMQFRLQARYRRAVTRRYLALPPAWHQRHATGTLLSNANSDVEAAFVPIAPLPFAVGTIVMIAAALVSLFLTDWVLALVGVCLFPALFGINLGDLKYLFFGLSLVLLMIFRPQGLMGRRELNLRWLLRRQKKDGSVLA